ncbi:MAG: DNA replication/repair protein RecF [Pseudomonadota bacterium]
MTQQTIVTPCAPRFGITRLSLNQFRTYASARVELDTRPAVLIGPNGIGKTNVLEAISFLGSGRGLRSATLQQPCRLPEEQAWAVSAQITADDALLADIGVGLDPASRAKRIVRINGAPASGPLAVTDYLSLSWLTPTMDRLFLEGTSGRRRFLDRMVLALHPAHAGQVNAYEKAMRQRNALLSEDRPADPAWLSAIENQMAEFGAAIAAARLELLSQLSEAIAAQPASAFPKAQVALEGAAETALQTQSASTVESMLIDLWAGMRSRDSAAGRTLEGPHRTDLIVRHSEKDQPADQCSTGEQKALLVGLILAHAQMIETLTGRGPILLLDEVAAHLDPERRGALFDRLSRQHGQSWITGTDKAFFDGFGGRAQVFRIDDGKIARDSEKG